MDALNAQLPENPERRWRAIPLRMGRFRRYLASDDGYIASILRHGKPTPRVLRPHIKRDERGNVVHMMVALSSGGDGPNKSATVARLVLMAFEGDKPGAGARFKDGNRGNATLANLEWR